MKRLGFSVILCVLAGGVQAEIKTVAEVEAAATECDTCLARQNGKRALRAYLAEKRAQEETEAQEDD